MGSFCRSHHLRTQRHRSGSGSESIEYPAVCSLDLDVLPFLIKKPRPAALRTKDLTVILLGVWGFVLLAFYTLGKLQTPSTRYLQLVTHFLLIAGYWGLANLCKVLPHRMAHYLVVPFVGLVIIYNTLLNAFLVLPSSHDFSEGVLSTYRAVGEFLQTNTPENSRVAVAIDVGAIGYYSEREVIDLGGLNSPEVIPYLPDGLAYVFISKPDYLVITGENSPYHLLEQARFRNVAVPVASFRADVGMRAKVGGATGEGNYYVSIYRLSWP